MKPLRPPLKKPGVSVNARPLAAPPGERDPIFADLDRRIAEEKEQERQKLEAAKKRATVKEAGA